MRFQQSEASKKTRNPTKPVPEGLLEIEEEYCEMAKLRRTRSLRWSQFESRLRDLRTHMSGGKPNQAMTFRRRIFVIWILRKQMIGRTIFAIVCSTRRAKAAFHRATC
jgi:hypothetical protein